MGKWNEIATRLKADLRLRTEPMAFRRYAEASEMSQVKNVITLSHPHTFCQAQDLVRTNGMTIGMTKDSLMGPRCARLHGLREQSEAALQKEAEMLSTTWFANPDQAREQLSTSPRPPLAQAMVMAPLAKEKIEPDLVLMYGNPAQLMMFMCGLQKERFERFEFAFSGEGACADSLGRCYATGKPALAVPCYGERAMGQVHDDELALAVPPGEIERAFAGLDKLARVGFKYPIASIGSAADPTPMLSRVYK